MVAVIFLERNVFNMDCSLDKTVFDVTSHTHSSMEEITQTQGDWERVSVGYSPHLEWDPLVLSGFTEGMSEEEDIIHSNSQSQEG